MPPLLLGHLVGIAIRPARGEPMVTLQHATLEPGVGIVQEHRRIGDKRQITLLSQQQWNDVRRDMTTPPSDLPWTARRANLLLNCEPLAALDESVLPPYQTSLNFPDRRPRDDQADRTFSLLPLIGQRLRIGKTAVIEPTVETKPCSHINALIPGLRAALLPAGRGGICCRVHESGPIQPGDTVTL